MFNSLLIEMGLFSDEYLFGNSQLALATWGEKKESLIDFLSYL